MAQMQEQTLQLEQHSKLKVSAALRAARSRGAGRRGAPGHLLRARLAWEAWEPMGRSGPAARGCPEREAWISAAGIRRSTRPPWSS